MFLVICCASFLYCQPPGAGALGKDLTTTLTPHYRALSRSLKNKSWLVD